MHTMNNSIQSNLPLPEFNDQISFRQRSYNDSGRPVQRPPKLFQKSHDSSYFNRSLNQSSLPHSISFKDHSQNGTSIQNGIYQPDKKESYFEQCFDILAKIGEGSFGEVFKVRSKEDGRLYAIKKSNQQYRGEFYRQERLEEVRRFEQFSEHEHCITLYKAWEQNDLLYMQLELCTGSLDTLLMQQIHLPEERIWQILVDLLLALQALHNQNLIHLDVKLDNIMIGENNVCKLGDFGLVVDLNRPNLHQAMEGDSRYIAPEILSGRFTKAADIFSLGITILELAYNLELPKNGHLWHVLRSGHLPDDFFKLLSSDLQSTIKWMMEPDPQRRPDVSTLLASNRIQKILAQRKALNPFGHVCAKGGRIIGTADTSTPQSTRFQPLLQTDDSFFRLDDSEIDFEESPNIKNNEKCFYKTPDVLIVNSTPLNHYNQGLRRNRSELSRTSLIFDDTDNIGSENSSPATRFPSNSNDTESVPPIKCKKLFDNLDDSD